MAGGSVYAGHMPSNKSFGFRVREKEQRRIRRVDGAHEEVPPEWHVDLPHQCDRWKIAPDESGDADASHELAVERLESFIAEAQEALEALKERREFGDGRRYY